MTLIQRGIAMIDITRGVLTADRYPGDPAPELRSELVGEYLRSTLSFCLHTGTPVDAPLHYLPGGKAVDQLDVKSLSGLCLLVEGWPSAEEFSLMKRRKIEILLLKGCFVTRKLLPELEALGIKTIGNDQLSIAPSDAEREIHEALFARGIVPLECLKLNDVSPGLYRLLALPMLIERAEAAPVRAFLCEAE